jgi:hypothetical protein
MNIIWTRDLDQITTPRSSRPPEHAVEPRPRPHADAYTAGWDAARLGQPRCAPAHHATEAWHKGYDNAKRCGVAR